MVYPTGEVVAAAEAGKVGTGYTLSTLSGCLLEDVKQATSSPAWYQLYLLGGKEVALKTIQRAKSQKSMYLRDQWSDSVHTLRFDSTDEYFKTVEYEEQRSTELRDSERKPVKTVRISGNILSTNITPDIIFSDFELRVSRNHFHMKLCNGRIDFKISLGLLSWFIIIRKITFWCVVGLLILDPIVY